MSGTKTEELFRSPDICDRTAVFGLNDQLDLPDQNHKGHHVSETAQEFGRNIAINAMAEVMDLLGGLAAPSDHDRRRREIGSMAAKAIAAAAHARRVDGMAEADVIQWTSEATSGFVAAFKEARSRWKV